MCIRGWIMCVCVLSMFISFPAMCIIIQFAEFDQIMRSDPKSLVMLVERVSKWLVCKRWKKFIFGAISVQKCTRTCMNIV